MKIIDVSKYNGVINWTKAAKNCEGVIIRAGYSGYGSGKQVTDAKFNQNIKGALAAGLKVGVYFVTQAVNITEAKREAKYTAELLRGYEVTLPVFIDSEDGNGGKGRADHGKLSKSNRTYIVKTFCEEIENRGYRAGIYASESWYKSYLDIGVLKRFYIWVAKYSKNKPTITFDAWQYSDKGKVNGITGNVDLSDFTEIEGKTNYDIALEVLDGKWGNGIARRLRLEAKGYDYHNIQDLVNKILKERGKK